MQVEEEDVEVWTSNATWGGRLAHASTLFASLPDTRDPTSSTRSGTVGSWVRWRPRPVGSEGPAGSRRGRKDCLGMDPGPSQRQLIQLAHGQYEDVHKRRTFNSGVFQSVKGPAWFE